MSVHALPANLRIVFVGGGNMASAIMGGLLRTGFAASHIMVIDPYAPTRERLAAMGVASFASVAEAAQLATQSIQASSLWVWAVKPQQFKEAAQQCAPYLPANALHLSVAAGIGTQAICRWLGTGCVVRAMPNTPALIGQGISALFACASVSPAQRETVNAVLASTGQLIWLQAEEQLDAVTALSGSGPAYVFYFLEAMVAAGTSMGLSTDAAKQLALATFKGATALAAQSSDSLGTLREKVTSKGGTTYAALTHMQANDVAKHFVTAMQAAQARAAEMGRELVQ